ncbi:flippase-like domain-containing protein [Planctomonas sp. JC2975]|uniref:lysylphosphatidylglycerol synthase transmembrane domain-containing protein n=1 Tax=Planctomonas sp. JC2975 TaxID=2729626 RepID=UPI001473C4F4|nr:lysylphosphatidylglycerol synthase transmembrane domain-containing protein [Planctomonas sp. JC2975]NNC13608.1 flippase-like domain-containing protein [Planctomonas sp. JC2975]
MAGLMHRMGRARVALTVLAAVLIIGATVLAVGVGPFLNGIASVSPTTIAIAFGLTAVATAAAAWRWRVVASRLGMPLSWRDAFASYYRAIFLNTVLPGGVVGDVHRAYAQGRREQRIAVAARSVVAERVAGQIVQTSVTLAVLVPLGLSSALGPLSWVGAALAALVAITIGAVAATRRGRAALAREARMLRPLITRPVTLVAIVASSVVVVAAHATTFIVAGLAAGVDAEPAGLGAVALVVLCASAIPINVGGWGPREAASASAFALIGLGAGAGVVVSAAFGVLTMLAVVPGAVVLLGDGIRAQRRAAHGDGDGDGTRVLEQGGRA